MHREERAGREKVHRRGKLGCGEASSVISHCSASTFGHLKRLWLVWAGQRRFEGNKGRGAQVLSADPLLEGRRTTGLEKSSSAVHAPNRARPLREDGSSYSLRIALRLLDKETYRLKALGVTCFSYRL